MASPKSKPRTIVRDSGSGKFVPKSRAITSPKTTETEVVRRHVPAKKK